MHVHPSRLRQILARAILAATVMTVALVGAGSVLAAEPVAPAAPAAPSATVAGTGVLTAQGDGRVRLAGSYVLAGSLDGGTLRIEGAGIFSTIRVDGWNSKTRLADGTLIYRFGAGTGHFVIGGRTIVTSIESHAMRFTAGGHGRAWLIGTGTYWANGHGPFPWTDPAAATATEASGSADF